MTDTQQSNIVLDVIRDVIAGIGDLFTKGQHDLITILRQPTPIKYTRVITADAAGNIGGGLNAGNIVDVYRCPVSAEGWINRIAITAAGYGPKTPLTQGQAYLTGSTFNELIMMLPVAGQIAPLISTEGRLSAPHLNPGEQLLITGDGFPANVSLKIDLQIVLVQGVSEYTPKVPAKNLVSVLD